MHSITHLLVASALLLALGVPTAHALLFSFLFAVLIDLDILVGRRLGKPRHHSRTWVQEPFGVLILAVPIGLIAQQFIAHGFILVIIPYASHIILDYLSHHEVSPLAPFKKWDIRVGLFRPFRERAGIGPSEIFVFIPAAIVCALLV